LDEFHLAKTTVLGITVSEDA